jgi:hypothetical protein
LTFDFTWAGGKSNDDEIACLCGSHFFARNRSRCGLRAKSATAAATNKQAISKACSDIANAKNLHGKERKKFRAKCKRNGGKM